MRKLNLSGEKYGRLLIVKEVEPFVYPSGRSVVRYLCRCDCGAKLIVRSFSLRSKYTKSCGCLRRETTAKNSTTHGQSKALSEYRTWQGMKDRCHNSTNISYKWYGAKGVRVCDRWIHSFENFILDMGRKPSRTHSIDRINPSGNYEPSNCRWATPSEQTKNRSVNKKAI
jgi:hypothetical protein